MISKRNGHKTMKKETATFLFHLPKNGKEMVSFRISLVYLLLTNEFKGCILCVPIRYSLSKSLEQRTFGSNMYIKTGFWTLCCVFNLRLYFGIYTYDC